MLYLINPYSYDYSLNCVSNFINKMIGVNKIKNIYKNIKLLGSLDIHISNNVIQIQTDKDIMIQVNNFMVYSNENVIIQTNVNNNKKIYLNPLSKPNIVYEDFQNINTNKIQWGTNK